MQLSDIDIYKSLKLGDISIENFDKDRLQPASYDVLLGSEFLVFDNHKIAFIDPKNPVQDSMSKVSIEEDDFFIIHPGEFVLGATWEKIGVNEKFACQIMGKSSLARLGLIIHTTAGFIDPGNNLRITLEFVNTNTIPIKLYPKMKIAQVAFYELKTPAEKPYGTLGLNSKYLNSESVQASQMHKNY
ncbi:MAG: dCTP deaminase [candidate division SR1 bacterium]|nr:dCTP deaminase [candidate division SR1 bacterium]